MFVVSVYVSENDFELIGPFNTLEWAKKYIKRIAKYNYHKTEIIRMMSPILLGLVDDKIDVVFDPNSLIDK